MGRWKREVPGGIRSGYRNKGFVSGMHGDQCFQSQWTFDEQPLWKSCLEIRVLAAPWTSSGEQQEAKT